jgi:alcohol dehydrogenase class IV
MLPHSLRMMSVRVPDAIGRLSMALGAEREDPERAVARTAVLSARAEVTTLQDLDVEWAQLDDVVQAALSRPDLRLTPEPPGARELKDLLIAAYG